MQTSDETSATGELDHAAECLIFPHEEVRYYFHYRNNYIVELDRRAEPPPQQDGFAGRSVNAAPEASLKRTFEIAGETAAPAQMGLLTRRHDADRQTAQAAGSASGSITANAPFRRSTANYPTMGRSGAISLPSSRVDS